MNAAEYERCRQLAFDRRGLFTVAHGRSRGRNSHRLEERNPDLMEAYIRECWLRRLAIPNATHKISTDFGSCAPRAKTTRVRV